MAIRCVHRVAQPVRSARRLHSLHGLEGLDQGLGRTWQPVKVVPHRGGLGGLHAELHGMSDVSAGDGMGQGGTAQHVQNS